MIYYSILYPPLLPISIPAFELKEPTDRWRLYFDTSIGNKIDDFRGGFIRIRRADSEVSVFPKDELNPYYYDFVPFRNPFAEYEDPYGNNSEFQPEGYPENMPSVHIDENDNYYIDVPHRVFSRDRGHIDQRFKVQIMLTKDWISSENEDGSGDIKFYNTDLQQYSFIDKNSYFGGNLVEKGLSEWSRVTLVSPVSEAKYELLFEKWGDTEKGYLNSPIVEFIGARIEESKGPNQSFDGNYLKAYKISIFNLKEGRKDSLFETSGWIIGQENPNLEIRWQNELEFEDKTNYLIELEIQTLWELRKTFVYEVVSNFEASLFSGKVEAINDHDKARAKIVITARSPLTWGPRSSVTKDLQHFGFAKMNGTVGIEQGVDITPKNGSFAGEMIVAGIEPIQHWDEDESRFFFRLRGPELSVHNPYQEEYLLYAHSLPITEKPSVPIYEEDILINPVMRSADGLKTYQSYMDTSGAIATQGTEAPASHTYFFLLDQENRVWRVTVSGDGVFVTRRAFEYDGQIDEEVKDVYLYDRHNLYASQLRVGLDGVLFLDRAFKYELGKQTKPLYINEFRLVKRIWGLELGRKRLIMKQTYKAFMNDFNRKLGKWQQISPERQYYIYFASTKGQLYMLVKDINAIGLSSQNAIDRYNMSYTDIGVNMPGASLFALTDGVDNKFLPIEDEMGRRIAYAITVDERGSLVAEQSFIGSSTTSGTTIRKKGENLNG